MQTFLKKNSNDKNGDGPDMLGEEKVDKKIVRQAIKN